MEDVSNKRFTPIKVFVSRYLLVKSIHAHCSPTDLHLHLHLQILIRYDTIRYDTNFQWKKKPKFEFIQNWSDRDSCRQTQEEGGGGINLGPAHSSPAQSNPPSFTHCGSNTSYTYYSPLYIRHCTSLHTQVQ